MVCNMTVTYKSGTVISMDYESDLALIGDLTLRIIDDIANNTVSSWTICPEVRNDEPVSGNSPESEPGATTSTGLVSRWQVGDPDPTPTDGDEFCSALTPSTKNGVRVDWLCTWWKDGHNGYQHPAWHVAGNGSEILAVRPYEKWGEPLEVRATDSTEPPFKSNSILEERENGFYYTGPLEPAKRVMLRAYGDDLTVEHHDDGGWTVTEHRGSTPDDPNQWGLGATEEEAWRYLIGGDFGPLDDTDENQRRMLGLDDATPSTEPVSGNAEGDPDWRPLVTVDYAENPSYQGTVYRLRHHAEAGGEQIALLWETGDDYGELAAIIDRAFPIEGATPSTEPVSGNAEVPYDWYGWTAETDNDNHDDRANVYYLTITEHGEEYATIFHRTCPDKDTGVEEYPLDGDVADEKVRQAEQMVAALNAYAAERATPSTESPLVEGERTPSVRELFRAAYDLIGDGQGGEWDVNSEYTRGIVELLADTCGFGLNTTLDDHRAQIEALIRRAGTER